MSATQSTETPPRWDLSNVYPGLESPTLSEDMQRVAEQLTALEQLLEGLPMEPGTTSAADLNKQAGEVINRMNVLLELSSTVDAYIYSFVSTDSYNEQAMRLLSQFEQIAVRLQQCTTRFTAWVGKAAPQLEDIIAPGGSPKDHTYFLRLSAEQSKYLMSAALEDLSAELSLSSTNAWGKLQGTVTSQLSVDFELDGKVQTLPMPALINLHAHPDESVRRRAYEAEMAAWKSVEVPLAAAMNGVKGWAVVHNRRRGRQDALHSAIDDAHIDRPTLEAMLDAMVGSFPTFRRYFHAKAARLGKDRLAWWDVFAPTGKTDTHYSYTEARSFILENFGKFSPDLAAFARRAFDQGWIDAEQRKGKRGGAFCMSVPVVKESRVLCNFDGSLDQVSTIAHELGHAFHNECRFKAGKTEIQGNTPMTLAETASIMCETIAVNAALQQAADSQTQLGILETSLVGDAQVIVDIYSRYLFEKEVFERRANVELSPQELCEIMERAQIAAYGDGLDERYLHKYMWTWKPHYYYSGLSFYNFPYAFGLLFGTGLYAIYEKQGPAFVADYQRLLASTGEAPAAELAAQFGIDIRKREFWEGSLSVIARRIDRYTQL
jgi:oligoendopeptidase F